MPSPSKGPRLGGSPAHERLMLANLATALFEHGRITTTEAKAKRLRPLAERLVTFAKRGDLHARRRVMTVIGDKDVVHVLFTEIGPRFDNRQGGYTRITKIGPRKGDNAPMAVIELVEALDESKPKKQRATRKPKGTAAPADVVAEAVTEVSEEPVADGAVEVTETVGDAGQVVEETAESPDQPVADSGATPEES